MILAGDIGGTNTRLAFFEIDSQSLVEVEVYPSRDYESLDEIHWEGTCYRPFPSEGGHADFAPRNRTEAQLLFFLMKEYPHVSYERILSGPGLYNIYRFLRDTGRGNEPRWLSDEIGVYDPAPVIARHGLSNASELCSRALDQFVSIYGAEAGNLALKLVATGGLFIGGGIAPKTLPKLEDETFMKAFTDKGRLSPVLERVPVKLIRNDRCALYGAARLAQVGVGKC